MHLSGKVMPRRGAAKRASISILQDAQDSGSDSNRVRQLSTAGPSKLKARGGGSTMVKEMDRNNLSHIKTYSVKRKRRAAATLADDVSSSDEIPSSSSVTVAAGSPIKTEPDMKGGKEERLTLSMYTSDGDDSDLTPLTSPIEPLGKLANHEGTSPQEHLMTREHPMFITKSPVKESLTGKARPQSSWEAKEAKWNLEDLGQFVWVHLDGKNCKTAGIYTTRSKAKESLWWPAFVSDGLKIPLKVKLYGKPARTMNIGKPCSDNVLPRLHNFSLRFDSYEVALQSHVGREDLALNSPRKRLKHEDEHKTSWDSATHQMLEKAQEASLETDDLPHPMEALTVMTALRRTGSVSTLKLGGANASKVPRKGKRKRSEESEPDVGILGRETSQAHPFDDFELPGELVFAKGSKPRQTDYWPAKLIEYIPPKQKGKQGTYKVGFLDMSLDEVPRSHFYTMGDDGFASCKLGQFESAEVDDTNDEDEDGNDEELCRSPSPVCRDPPPPQAKFITLSLREQFGYVKPILHAILGNEYGPSKDKFQVFVSGTKRQQASLSEISSDRGLMDPRQVKELSVYVKHWCLRDEKMAHPRGASILEEDLVSDVVDGSGLSASLAPSSSAPAPTEPGVSASSPAAEPLSSSSSPAADISLTQGGSLVGIGEEIKILAALENPILEAYIPPGCNVDVASQSLRQKGSPEYEALSAFRRLDFCLNILLPEAIRQILLWRSGDRTSLQLLSNAEEMKLYEEGQKLLEERDWVQDIMRLRKRVAKEVEHPSASSRSGRRTNIINYAE